MIVGAIAALINGAAIPLLGLLTGSVINAFASDDIIKAITPNMIYFIAVGGSTFLLSMVQNACWSISG